MQYYVYLHIKPTNNGVHSIFYVGKGNENRIKTLSRPHNKHHCHIVKKYGENNIKIKKYLCHSEEHALKIEIAIISILRFLKVSLVNATNGGDGASGLKHSDASKKLISDKTKGCKNPNYGKKHSAETLKLMSLAKKGKKTHSFGKPMSEEQKIKLRKIALSRISNPRLGCKHSEETKKLISQKAKGHKRCLGRKHSKTAKEKQSLARSLWFKTHPEYKQNKITVIRRTLSHQYTYALKNNIPVSLATFGKPHHLELAHKALMAA